MLRASGNCVVDRRVVHGATAGRQACRRGRAAVLRDVDRVMGRHGAAKQLRDSGLRERVDGAGRAVHRD